MNAAEWRRWAQQVLRQLDKKFGSLTDKTVEIHAGMQYRHPDLLAGLAQRGAHVTVPLEQMSLSQQIAWYRSRLEEAAPLGHTA